MNVEIWGKENCGFCTAAKSLAESKGVSYIYKQMGVDFTRDEVFEQFPNARTFPQIKVNDEAIGGYNEFSALFE
jgi:glutaredoxin 3